MNKRSSISIAIVAGLTAVIAATLYAQLGPQRGPQVGGASLSEPFQGIKTNGKIDEGLFKIESTGVTTKPVVDAARAFLAGLSDEQKKRTEFPVDDVEWRQWDNRHMSKRQGVGFDEMDELQRTLAFDLMGKSLSAKGLKLSQDIMKLNGTLAELTNNYREYGEWLYWITIMGTPSETEPWGWQIDGHHLVINYFVLGDQVVMSPVFIGSEPVHATSGKFAGTIIMQDEQNAGLAFMRSLNEAQQKEATVSSAKPGNNNLTEAYKDNANIETAGLVASKLDDKQRAAFLELIGKYVGNMRDDHAKVKMSEVEQHLNRTYFAWVGGTSEESVMRKKIKGDADRRRCRAKNSLIRQRLTRMLRILN